MMANERTLRADDPRLGMKESDLQAAVVDLATVYGWLHYHTHDSRRSNPGFPDLVLWHPVKRRTLFVELKSSRGVIRHDQTKVMETLRQAGNVVHLWRPADWLLGIVEHELRGE